ncbi:dehydrogenase/reductase SDR family member 13-like, partial [Sinocyclocheilus grahami]|uniref:dehydrogenase/reductase SDR family member 13-like n=1 Tax=Sinocyclocheilus grahami TaxID=75366 RepID=UPI0007AD5C27
NKEYIFHLLCLTGGNTGIGKATSAELATRGARVILACRSKQRGEAAAQEIRMETGNDAVIFMQLDLASHKSIRSFAETFLKAEPRLDLLINNAALAAPGRTEDGIGMILGVNHIGSFLLTNLLLERSVRSELARDINEWHTHIIKAIISKFWATDPVSGAQTTLYCALQENIEHLSGRYFSDCQLVQVKPEARDDGIAKKLWDV